jgi:hypothetical protein
VSLTESQEGAILLPEDKERENDETDSLIRKFINTEINKRLFFTSDAIVT